MGKYFTHPIIKPVLEVVNLSTSKMVTSTN